MEHIDRTKIVVFLKLEITEASGDSANLEELGRKYDLSSWGVDTVWGLKWEQ